MLRRRADQRGHEERLERVARFDLRRVPQPVADAHGAVPLGLPSDDSTASRSADRSSRTRSSSSSTPSIQLENAPASGCYIGAGGVQPSAGGPQPFTTLASAYGVPTGSAGPVFTKNPLTNIFARVDFVDLPFNSTLMLRYNYGGATQDVFSRGSTGSTPTSRSRRTSTSSSRSSVRRSRSFGSNFKNGAYNELFSGYTTIRDVRAPCRARPDDQRRRCRARRSSPAPSARHRRTRWPRTTRNSPTTSRSPSATRTASRSARRTS